MNRALLLLGPPLLAGCVSAGSYHSKGEELLRQRRECIDREKALLGRIGALEKQADEQAARLKGDGEARGRLTRQLDDATALIGELRERLLKTGASDESLSADAAPHSDSFKEARERLEELRRKQVAAEAIARIHRGLLLRLREPIDAGKVQVTARDGHLLLTLPDDVLFEAGKGQLRPEGQAVLVLVAEALKGLPDRRFLVTGHSDDLPVRGGRPGSNWELSVSRALDVTRQLLQAGVRPQALGAAGFGEFDPLYPNDSAEHRAQNRRVEIVLLPTAAELPSLDLYGAAGG